MEQRYRVIVVWLLTILLILGSPGTIGLCSAAQSQLQAPRGGSQTSVRESYDAVLDLVSQDTGCPASEASHEVRWMVCVRIRPGHPAEFEYVVFLEKHYDGTLLARATRARGQSIYTQLARLKEEHPDASVQELIRLIVLETQSGDQKTFPALVKLAREFEAIRVSPVLQDALMMDATEYEIAVRSFSGERLEMTLLGPGSSAPKQPYEFLEWTESLRRVLF